MRVVRRRVSKDRVIVEPWGQSFRARCDVRGCPWQCIELGEASTLDSARDHLRFDHPTEDEAAAERVRAAEWELPGCRRCGHEDHESADCPIVTPDLLKAPT